MLVGTPPFKRQTQYLTFQNILEGKVTYPQDMDQDAQDFISQLLKKNPKERLGAEGSFEKLKSHPFLQDTPPVIIKPTIPRVNFVTSLSQNILPCEQEDNQFALSRWIPFETIFKESTPKVIYSGVVQKKGKGTLSFFYKKRKLVLTDEPRFMYFKLSVKGDILQGNITISPQLKAELIKPNRFHIITPKRIFVFKVRFYIGDRQQSTSLGKFNQ